MNKRKFFFVYKLFIIIYTSFAIFEVFYDILNMCVKVGGVKVKLRTKLIVAFLSITIIPIILMVIAYVALGNYQLKSIEEKYGIEGTDYDTFSNSIQILSKFTKSIYTEMQETASDNVGAYEYEPYLKELNKKLNEKYSFLLVRKDDKIIYKGTDTDITLLKLKLPEFGDTSAIGDGGVYVAGDVQALIKTVDFYFEDGSRGNAFIITGVNNAVPQIKQLLVDMLIATIIILGLTSGVMIVWIYRGVSVPIKRLQTAADNIKEGNLDFEIEHKRNDEIGQLCNDFEDMRQRLKISAEEKLQYDTESKELISNISHDLKTPITAVKGYVEGIMDGVADTPEKMEKYIKTIYNKANDMDRLINELTFYSKIDTNKIPYTFTKINVGRYFDDCVEEIGFDLSSHNIELAYFNYADADTQIIADPEQLRKVINNIVGNSVKYMDKQKGFINIRVKDIGEFIQVEIEDNGKGIAQTDLPYIFDRFYRADASRNSTKGGSGIGLSIVKKIIEDHGGSIWATSKEDTGTVMYFTLKKNEEEAKHE